MSMNYEDRQAIEGLFTRLGDVERQAGARDPEADDLIRQKVAAQPGAPYFMAQTIVMQEFALQEAQRRIEELERRAARPASGGLLSGLFGGGQGGPEPRASQPQSQPPPRSGGFLAGAAQTAMGVAGGVLIGNAMGGLFSSGAANASESTPPVHEPQVEEGGGFFDGLFGGDEEF